MSYTPTQYRDQRLIWLLSVTYAGRVFRWSTEPIDMVDDQGNAVSYPGGLDPMGWETALGDLTSEPDYQSLPAELVFPIDVAQWVAQGHTLAGSPAELAYVLEGETYDSRQVVLTGKVQQPEYGEDGEPVAFSIEEQPGDDRALIPRVDEVSDGAGGVYPDEVGLPFPYVFGRPGRYIDTAGDEQFVAGSPALWAYHDVNRVWCVQAMVASQAWSNEAESAAPTISPGSGFAIPTNQWGYLFNSAGVSVPLYLDRAISTSFGAANRLFTFGNADNGSGKTTVDGSDIPAGFYDEAPFWWSWRAEAPAASHPPSEPVTVDYSAAPALRTYSPQAGTGAGDIVLELLSRSTIPLDQGRWETLRRWLNRFKLSGYIDERISPWEYLVSEVFPLLPMSVVNGPAGLRPVPHRIDATSRDAVEKIVAGPGIDRVGRVEYLRHERDRVEEVTVRFALNAADGNYMRSITLTSEPDADEIRTQWDGRQGQIHKGVRPPRSLEREAAVIYDEETARAVARWLYTRHAGNPRRVRYQLPIEYAHIEEGDVVLLTDDTLYLDEHLALVSGISHDAPDAITLSLVLYDDVMKNARYSAA